MYSKVEQVAPGRFAPVLKVRGEGRVALGEYESGEAANLRALSLFRLHSRGPSGVDCENSVRFVFLFAFRHGCSHAAYCAARCPNAVRPRPPPPPLTVTRTHPCSWLPACCHQPAMQQSPTMWRAYVSSRRSGPTQTCVWTKVCGRASGATLGSVALVSPRARTACDGLVIDHRQTKT